MMKKLSLMFMILFVLFMFSACGTEPFEGEVCELKYQEAYTTTVIVPVTVWNGKTASVITIPYIWSYPDRWRVKVREYDDEKDEFIYHECYVTEEIYNSLKIGDWFIYNEDYCYPNEPYTHEKA